jgi:hypothetical protein
MWKLPVERLTREINEAQCKKSIIIIGTEVFEISYP